MNLFEISNEYLAILQLAEDPDVDPEVLIPQASPGIAPGLFCKVCITQADDFDLYAEVSE